MHVYHASFTSLAAAKIQKKYSTIREGKKLQNGATRPRFVFSADAEEPSALADNTNLGLHNSRYHAQPHSMIIVKCCCVIFFRLEGILQLADISTAVC